MMLRGLWKLTWIELKIFLREPLGRVRDDRHSRLVFIIVGRVVGRRLAPSALAASNFIASGCPFLRRC